MKNIFNQKPLPEKVIVKLEEILFQLLPVLEDSVADGRAVDAELSAWLRARRELGSRDRRFLSESIFRHFRWMGWTRVSLKLNLPEATLLSALLEQEAPTQWSEYLSKKIKVVDDLNESDIIFGIKEVPISELIANKTYFMFSHTIKKQSYNRELLKTIIKKGHVL